MSYIVGPHTANYLPIENSNKSLLADGFKETDYVAIFNNKLVLSGKTNDTYKLHYNAHGNWKICHPLESISRYWAFPLMFKLYEGAHIDFELGSDEEIEALKVITETMRKLEEEEKRRAKYIAKSKLSNQGKKRIKKTRQPIQLTPDTIEAYHNDGI